MAFGLSIFLRHTQYIHRHAQCKASLFSVFSVGRGALQLLVIIQLKPINSQAPARRCRTMRASMRAVRLPKVELTLLQRRGWQMTPPPKMQQPPHWGRGVPGSQPEPHGMRSDLSVTVYSEALSQRLSRRRRKVCLVHPQTPKHLFYKFLRICVA